MREMVDGITPEALPPGYPIYASYVDTYGNGYFRLATLFPGKIHASIAVHAIHDANILDVENGAASVSDAPSWTLRQRARGSVPYVYSNSSTWPRIMQAFAAAGVAPALWWAANYSKGPNLYPGSVSTQYRTTPGYDLSVVADHLPGIDPEPVQPIKELGDMQFISNYNGHTYVVSGDLSGKMRIATMPDLQSFWALPPPYNQYLTHNFSDEQMALIPDRSLTPA